MSILQRCEELRARRLVPEAPTAAPAERAPFIGDDTFDGITAEAACTPAKPG